VKNGWPIRASSPSSMPSPSSSTWTQTSPPSIASGTRGGALAASDASTAFLTRFATVRRSATRGARKRARRGSRSTRAPRPRSASSASSSSTKRAASMSAGASPCAEPARWPSSSRRARHRSTSARTRRASSRRVASPRRSAARSSSFATTRMVPSGVPSSCAAVAASDEREASFSWRRLRRSASARLALDAGERRADRAPLLGLALVGRPPAHSGMFPCLRRGRSTRFVSAASRASTSATRVSRGGMTSSTKPRSAAVNGFAKRAL